MVHLLPKWRDDADFHGFGPIALHVQQVTDVLQS